MVNQVDSEDDEKDDPTDDITLQTQPPTMSTICTMRSYQLYGMSWLVSQYDKCINCILAGSFFCAYHTNIISHQYSIVYMYILFIMYFIMYLTLFYVSESINRLDLNHT